jgi:hypothetical protein
VPKHEKPTMSILVRLPLDFGPVMSLLVLLGHVRPILIATLIVGIYTKKPYFFQGLPNIESVGIQ